MKADIPVLSPDEVKHLYVNSGSLMDAKQHGELANFTIARIEELMPFLKLPHPPFKNTAHGFVFVQQGALVMQMEGQAFIINANQFILTPAGQINCFLDIQANTKGFMGTFADYLLVTSLQPSHRQSFASLLNPVHLPHFNLSSSTQPILANLCERLFTLYAQSFSEPLALIPAYLAVLLAELDLLSQKEPMTRSPRSHALVLAFKQLLIKSIPYNPSPANLAYQLNVSINHLNKVLKQQTSYSTREWIIRRQIVEAQVMLKQSTLSIADIAYALGFDSPAYFAKFFRRYTGQSPSQYRYD